MPQRRQRSDAPGFPRLVPHTAMQGTDHCNLRNTVASATMAVASGISQSPMAGFEGASPNARLLTGQSAGTDAGAQRLGGAFSVSMLSHLAGFLLILFVMSLPATSPVAKPPFEMPAQIVWLDQAGPGGGGGGGGNKAPSRLARRKPPALRRLRFLSRSRRSWKIPSRRRRFPSPSSR